jgi:RNA polymerase sigma factor (sigma-70 family)
MTQVQFNNALLALSDKLHYYALKLTSDVDRANDLLQETFQKVLTSRDTFSRNTNFNAWVYTIMRNTFINDYRRSVKTRNAFEALANKFHTKYSRDKVYPSPDPSPDSIYFSKEIRKSIEDLNDGYKIPFSMFVDGYRYKEIAEIMNLPLGTVKSRIFFARQKLEKVLREYSPYCDR